jgi:hypothetical protein
MAIITSRFTSIGIINLLSKLSCHFLL